MNYLQAVTQKNEQRKIAELQNIISIGEKLKKDVRPDKKKLEILLERQNSESIKQNSKPINLINLELDLSIICVLIII